MLQDHDLISIQEVRAKVEAAYAAWTRYRAHSQEQVDAIVDHMAEAARAAARHLAELAVEETGYGNAQDKFWKNMLSADLLPRTLRGMKTVGVLRELPDRKIVEIATPMGVVAAILPTTNPTSTAIYKTLIALKAGNAIVLSPHPRAKKCTCETAGILYQAAVQAGAPEGIVQCIDNASVEGTNELMRHRRTGVILSTGGSGMVRAAYSSGKPAFGVGPGNVPVLIDASADVDEAVRKVVEGKSFDYGTVCSSEQSIVAETSLRDRILGALKAANAYLATPAQSEALAKLLVGPHFTINPECVGQPPMKIARMAGFEVPANTSILAVEIGGVGKQHPLSAEKLSPVLSLLFVKDFPAALDACESILRFGGLGHTCVIHSRDDRRTREFGMRMPAFRVLVNTSSPQGSTGITTNVFPAMTLGCGAISGNITSDNIGPLHLINIKRIAYAVRTVEEAFPAPPPAASGVQSQVSAGSGMVNRQQIVAAVEKYLAQRGLSSETRQGAAPSSASAAEVVDRFLAARRPGPAQPAAASAPGGPSCGYGSCDAPGEPGRTAEPEPVAQAAPEPAIADFVCENDVREALRQKRKIHVGPKTIVTPAARDLAAQDNTLVDAPIAHGRR
jgi:acetaldehyde dehydrogenase (acetylating)